MPRVLYIAAFARVHFDDLAIRPDGDRSHATEATSTPLIRILSIL